MKVGRNDPCPCGSGKKYKKCHLEADERAAQSPPPTPPRGVRPAHEAAPTFEAPPAPEPSADELRWERFWEEYAAASIDARVAMVRRALREESDLGGGALFEVFDGLSGALQREGRTDEFEALLREAEALHPEAVREERGWFALWRTENALLRGDDPLPPMLAWAAAAARFTELFHRTLDRLAFRGDHRTQAAVLPVAWRAIEGDDDMLGSALDDFRSRGVMTVLHTHREARPGLDAVDPALRADLAPYGQVKIPWVEAFLRVDGGAASPWPRRDLASAKPAQALDGLLIAFGRALRERWGWPRARAELARTTLLEMLLGAKATTVEGRVLPSAAAIEKAVNDHFSLLGLSAWRGVALFAALPAWLTFVADEGLASPEAARTRRDALAPRVSKVASMLEEIEYDPTVRGELERAWAV
jgi:hypothetical protein